MDILTLIQRRQSSRVLFDPERRISEAHVQQILEGARWAPTAHNMQNFEIVVVDDRVLLDELSKIPTEASQRFVEENYQQLSFSEEELMRKKVGLLGLMFPPSWRTPGVRPHVEEAHAHSILGDPFKMSAAVLVVLFDPSKRAPASESQWTMFNGDFLGMISLGCVMENMWLVAQSLGIGFQVQSVINADRVERDVKRILSVPEHLKIAFAVRLGYPKTPDTYLRVRRDVQDFTHRNRFGQRRVAAR
jgi:nitroreductase